MARQPTAQPAPQPAPEPVATTGGPPAHEAGGILTIDLAAIHANYRLLAGRVVPGECAAVVKGDAYGCGIDQVSAALSRAGCKTFFVANLTEARRVRAQAQEATIYVLNGFSSGSAQSFVDCDARPVISSSVELAEWDNFVASSKWTGGAALHVDTGMNRLGLTIEEAAAVAPRIQTSSHSVALLMSHLACADQPNHPLNDRQIRQFREIRSLFRGISSSLANSPGIFLDSSTYCDMVRPGVALYGGNPTPGQANPMRPVVRLEGRIIQLRTAETGETVGYNAQWTVGRRRRLATVSVGYADGYPRAASATDAKRDAQIATGEAIVAGLRCPFAGRVSMDLIAVDVSDVPEGAVRRGDLVTLIGDDLTIDEVGRRAGTIGYEVLTSLGRRYARRYLGGW